MDELINRKYGKLTVIEYAGTHTSPCGTKRNMWRCKCECGKEVIVAVNNLKNGSTKSCGCWKHGKLKEYNTTHAGSKDRLYKIWLGMKRRCNSPKDKCYRRYGAKGIKVCDEWNNDYQSFKKWAYANGYDEKAQRGKCTIDRIDNSGNYEPNNCRWVDLYIQANNTSKNHYVELNGVKMTIAEFARVMNISNDHAWYYINKFDKEIKNE